MHLTNHLRTADPQGMVWTDDGVIYHRDEIGSLARWLATRKQQLIAARQEAEQATKAKSAFLARMSHELRTPLPDIIGVLPLLEDSDLQAEQRGLLRTIRNSGAMLLTLISDILDLSKIVAGRMTIALPTGYRSGHG